MRYYSTYCFLLSCQLSVLAVAAPSWNPPHIARPTDDSYRSVETRAYQAVPAIAVSESGRIWVTWHAGPTGGEDSNNYVVVATSGDNGRTWGEVLSISHPDVRIANGTLWIDPQGRMWLFWRQTLMMGSDAVAASQSTDQVIWAMVTDQPDQKSPQWSSPRPLMPGTLLTKPTVISDGTWLFPVESYNNPRMTSRVWASADQGVTFTYRGDANLYPENQRGYPEPMLLEQLDGRVKILVRTRYGIGESVSPDGGVTWPDLRPSGIAHASSRFFIRRLGSGNLLLVKHGPIEERIGRSHLMAFVSLDDGETWGGGLLLDERANISYPDGHQTSDGTIYIVYDHSRLNKKEIYMAVFSERDALKKTALSDRVRLRVNVTRGVRE